MKLIFSIILGFLSLFSYASVQDSVGTTRVNGLRYIIHIVEKGDTFYSLSKKYKKNVSQLRLASKNNETLSIGEKLLIPILGFNSNTKNVHKVQVKETLYSISKKYNVSIESLKKWNNLKDNSLNEGQKLIVGLDTFSGVEKQNPNTHKVVKGETLYSISKQFGLTISILKKWNNIKEGSGISIGQILIVGKKRSPSINSQQILLELLKEDSRFSDDLAQCLYNKLPIGTIVKITYTKSHKSIYVKVVGTINVHTQANILINTKALSRLGAKNKSFHVLISTAK